MAELLPTETDDDDDDEAAAPAQQRPPSSVGGACSTAPRFRFRFRSTTSPRRAQFSLSRFFRIL